MGDRAQWMGNRSFNTPIVITHSPDTKRLFRLTLLFVYIVGGNVCLLMMPSVCSIQQTTIITAQLVLRESSQADLIGKDRVLPRLVLWNFSSSAQSKHWHWVDTGVLSCILSGSALLPSRHPEDCSSGWICYCHNKACAIIDQAEFPDIIAGSTLILNQQLELSLIFWVTVFLKLIVEILVLNQLCRTCLEKMNSLKKNVLLY